MSTNPCDVHIMFILVSCTRVMGRSSLYIYTCTRNCDDRAGLGLRSCPVYLNVPRLASRANRLLACGEQKSSCTYVVHRVLLVLHRFIPPDDVRGSVGGDDIHIQQYISIILLVWWRQAARIISSHALCSRCSHSTTPYAYRSARFSWNSQFSMPRK